MKVIICGPRDLDDYELVCAAIQASGFEITEVVSGAAKGADSLGEKWAGEHAIPFKQFPARWNAMTQPGCIVKTNDWGKEYNANAGFYRNEEMAKYAEACIAVKADGDTPGTGHMIKTAEAAGLKVYVHKKKKEPGEYSYEF